MPAATTPLIYRIRLAIRLWHWVNALSVIVMLMSGMMIFNAHPRLYWGAYGANFDRPWLEIGNHGSAGYVSVLGHELPTTGVLGYSGGDATAFPAWATIPTHYSLAIAREWHFGFAWTLVLGWLAFFVWGLATGHFRRDLGLTREQRSLAHLWHDLLDHARLRFPTGEAARHYNPLQKIAYLGVLFVLLPLVVLTGLTMSPAVDAAWPWLLVLFDGRQSARSLHFLAASGLAGFLFIHLAMVVLAGPLNELRAMITGWYRLPAARTKEIQP